MIFPEGGIPDEDNPKMIPFKRGAFILAKQAQLPIVPMTFLNNYKLFSDPGKLLGPARPGVSRVIIHPFVSVNDLNEMTHDELKDHCFEIVNSPLKERYPDLYE
jgi:1-acyl-sn-glycerol-3-phosphate acyltransferase